MTSEPEDPPAGTQQAPPATLPAERLPVPGPRAARAEFAKLLRSLTPAAYVTPILIGLNVGIYLIMIARGVDPLDPTSEIMIRWGADFGPRTSNGEPWRLLSSMFLHFGAVHLLCNMIGLWGIGFLVERILGNCGYLLAYVAAGFCSSVASSLWHPYGVCAGASGAIFGLYGALLGFIVRQRDTIPRGVLWSLTSSGLTFIGYNFYFGLRDQQVDVAAHLGGLAGGFVCGLALSRPLQESSIGGRRRRNLALAASAFGFVTLSVLFLPAAVDFPSEIARFAKVEEEKSATLRNAEDQMRAGKMGEREFARIIESDVLPQWVAMRKEIDGWKQLPADFLPVAEILGQYARARENELQSMVEAINNHDPAKWKQVDEEYSRIKTLMDRMSALAKK